jgi:hypothetical protein
MLLSQSLGITNVLMCLKKQKLIKLLESMTMPQLITKSSSTEMRA